MGFGVLAAIGAKRLPIQTKKSLFVGDGGFPDDQPALAILNVYKIPIKVIMLNNHSLLDGSSSGKKPSNDGRTSESVFEASARLPLMAQAYGIKNYKFDNPETLEKD